MAVYDYVKIHYTEVHHMLVLVYISLTTITRAKPSYAVRKFKLILLPANQIISNI
jgi:hypothetical protein